MNVAIINCFDTYEHRVDLLYRYFSSKCDYVQVFESSFKHFEKTQRTDIKENYTFVKARPYYKNLSVGRLYSHAKLAKDIFKEIEQNSSGEEWDLLWVLLPPNSIVKAATKYKSKYPNTKLILDVIDLWPETMPISKFKSSPPFTFWRNLRDKYIDKSDFVVTECDLYQEKLVNRLPLEKMKTIYLAKEIKPFHENLNLPNNSISLCYLGSINNIIDIPVIEKIIKNIKGKTDITLHIIGDGERREELITATKKAGAKVIYHGKVYNPNEKQQIFNQCHYGLNIMKDSVYVGLTMKSIDYFEGGLPIINNIKGDTWEIIDKYGVGINTEGTFIDKLTQNYQQRKAARNFFECYLSEESFNNSIESVIRSVF